MVDVLVPHLDWYTWSTGSLDLPQGVSISAEATAVSEWKSFYRAAVIFVVAAD